MGIQRVELRGIGEVINNLARINRTLESIDRRLEQLNKDYQTMLTCDDEYTASDGKNDVD